jgi:hypothetical protein
MDRVRDILYMDECPPFAPQEPEELEDETIARLNIACIPGVLSAACPTPKP